MGAIKRRSFKAADERRTFPRGITDILRIGPLMVGRGRLEPGFRWSTDIGPIMGTTSCPIHHVQILLEGRFAVRMDDGEEIELAPDEVFEVPPGHDAWVVGDAPAVVLDFGGNIDTLATPQGRDRVLATLVMTDIVDSTRQATSMGDAQWRQLLANHNRLVRAQLDRYRGVEVKTTGDGFLARFGSAVGALRCATAIVAGVRQLGLEVRAGVHTGEIEVLADDIGGITVHAAARVMAAAGASEVMVSSLTRMLADGSGLGFEPRGRHEAKGLDAPLELYALEA